MPNVAVRLVADTTLVALLLVAAAGTLAWWRAWVLLAVLLIVRALGAVAVHRVNPALLRERAALPVHGNQPSTDRLLVLAVLGTGSSACPRSPESMSFAFATTTVRLQRERAHAVADAGVYAVIRHPFYAADPLILVGLALWLESYVAVLCASVPLSLMVIRLHLEERFLRRHLPGYDAYTVRVRYRLIPGVW